MPKNKATSWNYQLHQAVRSLSYRHPYKHLSAAGLELRTFALGAAARSGRCEERARDTCACGVSGPMRWAALGVAGSRLGGQKRL